MDKTDETEDHEQAALFVFRPSFIDEMDQQQFRDSRHLSPRGCVADDRNGIFGAFLKCLL